MLKNLPAWQKNTLRFLAWGCLFTIVWAIWTDVAFAQGELGNVDEEANKGAWDFFQSQPPSYRKMMSWYIMSAKTEETRSKRFEKLMKASASRKRL